MTNHETLLRDVQMTSFALVEATLYLDTHPECEKALEYFDRVRHLNDEATAKYEKMCGPLTVHGVDVSDGWTWTNEPMPWQMN